MGWDKQREKNNKFVQEMESEQITENDDKKEEKGSMDDLFQMLITKGMNKEKTDKFIKYLTANEYDSDSIIFDIENQEIMNDLSQCNIFSLLDQNKYFIKMIRHNFKIKGNDDDKVPVFSFGEDRIFYSWQYFE